MYKCQNERYRERLAFLGVDCTNDIQHVHPRYFCNRCYRAAPRQHTSPGSTPITPYLWKEHTESGCQVSSYIKTHLYKKMHRYTSTSDPSKGQGGNHLQKGVDHQLVERRCWQTTCTNSCERPEEYDLQNCPVSEESLLCRICDAILHHFAKAVSGFSTAVDQQLIEAAEIATCPEWKKCVLLSSWMKCTSGKTLSTTSSPVRHILLYV